MKRYLIVIFLWCHLCSILMAQGASFGTFEGKVYDLDDYELSKGYTPGVYKYDMVGSIKLVSLSVKKTNQAVSYFPGGVYMRDRFGIIFTSQLKVTKPGCYEFYLESDDGSILWIEDNVVIDNDSTHAMTIRRDTIHLKEGTFPVRVWYYNAFPGQFGLILNVNPVADTVICSKREFILHDILFDFNSHTLLPEGQAELDRFCKLLSAMNISAIHVVGHTDNVGSAISNKSLSLRRAQTVMEFIKSKVGSDIKMDAEGKGYEKPIATLTDPESQARNRRVEIFVE
ncbi:MAG TPA: OmpA family protein [Saprospiraceae bacterium]|nr:OmpA family protein [Saprospiraceae bacterium]